MVTLNKDLSEVDFTLNRNQILERAYRMLNVLGEGDTLSSFQIQEGNTFLNLILKTWESEGLRLFKRSWQVLPFSPTHGSLVMGSDNIIYECIRDHVATFDGAEPVQGVDRSLFWKKYTGPVTTAYDWKTGRSYNANSTISLSKDIIYIEKLVCRNNLNGKDYPVQLIGMDEYMDIADKEYSGDIPNTACFSLSRLIGDTEPNPLFTDDINRDENNYLYIYPRPRETSDFVLHALVNYRYKDMDNADSEIEFPQSYLLGLIYELASYLADNYGIDGRLFLAKADGLKRKSRRHSFNREKRSEGLVSKPCY